jgi:hypothetical protein
MVENDQEGRITELSESAVRILKEAGINLNNVGNSLLSVTDLVSDFDFKVFRKGQNERFQNREIYESLTKLDINVFSD